jgi:pyrroloquinoline quinone biosynthesis protein B
VQLVLLGTAAGGGFPQWNCWCAVCRVARLHPESAHPRTQSSLAVSTDGARWFLCNASPDIHGQLQRIATPPDAGAGRRLSPIHGIIFTDAELDHTLGLALLRESRSLAVYATAPVLDVMERDSRLLAVTRAFTDVEATTLPCDDGPDAAIAGEAVPLRYRGGAPSGLTVRAFAVPGDAPRFAGAEAAGLTVGLLLHDSTTGGTAAFVPGCGAIDDAVLARLSAASLVLFDGTFCHDDDMRRAGVSGATAREMGHVPMWGADGSLTRLAALPSRRTVFTHINNTNPVLVEDGPERLRVRELGFEVGDDGMRFTL